jgi:hypothetical protein
MSIGDEKKWKDLQELRRMYSLKDTRTPSTSFTVHGLRLERAVEGYRKDIQELNRMFALSTVRARPSPTGTVGCAIQTAENGDL